MTAIDKKILIMGTGGSGKTVYAKQFWTTFKCPMAYDINGDYKRLKGGITYSPVDIDGEFMRFIRLYKQVNHKKRVDALFFDDADSYINYKIMMHPEFKDLVVRQRNKYRVSLVFICKRPQNLPTWIVENCHVLRVFLMEGKNAIDRLNEVDTRIVDMLSDLKEYEHVYKEEGKEPSIKKPVKL